LNRINSSINTKNKKVKKEEVFKEEKKPKLKKQNIKKEKKHKKHPILRFIRNLLLLLIIITIIIGFLFYKKVETNGGGIKGVLCTLLGQSVEDLANLEKINVLVLGVSEDIETKLTDTIILCSYNPQEQSASMLSIPRDTFVGKNQNTAKGSDKINSLYSKNVNKTVDAVEKITDVKIDYYVVVKTSSLIKIVDILGSVDFDVPIDMDYDDPTQDLHIHLSKGMQKIDGEKAEQLLRFRHNNDGSSYPSEYGDNDYGRMKTQREFMQETLKQTLTLKNAKNAKKIINTIFDNIETNLTKDDCIPYIPVASEFDINSIVSRQLPGESKKCNNLWFFLHDKKETKEIISELF
jgi:LCP family protein required for cell wall assembly